MIPRQTIVPVLLSGGSGTRLWPLSREAYPKQFLPLIGPNTLLQDTALRAADQSRFGRMMVIANNEHRFLVAEQLAAIGISNATLVLEPIARNTAPAAAVAAIQAQEADADALLLLMPADHRIEDPAAFAAAVEAGSSAAREGRIVLFGITPDRPATGYGYIEAGTPISEHIQNVAAFVEKPDLATAAQYVAGGSHFWNSGIFLVGARILLQELERFVPDVVSAARAALVNGERDLDFLRLGISEFEKSPSISLDHAVMERTDRAAFVPVSCGWSDVGAWSALWDVQPKDASGNVRSGDVVVENAHNCYLRGENVMVAAVGVEDLIIVATGDVVMVTRKGHDEDLKRLVTKLKSDGRSAAIAPRRVHRPWGFYESIHDGHRFQVKRITVNPGGKLSLQKHYHRAEHWVVVNGTAMVTRDDEQILLRENESIYLPVGSVHRLENPGKLPLNLIEVQSGAYLGEDDIVRIEDVYARG